MGVTDFFFCGVGAFKDTSAVTVITKLRKATLSHFSGLMNFRKINKNRKGLKQVGIWKLTSKIWMLYLVLQITEYIIGNNGFLHGALQVSRSVYGNNWSLTNHHGVLMRELL